MSVMVPDAMEQLASEIKVKVRQGQAKVVLWDDIKDNPPEELKVSPIATIPHKSRAFCAIFDLSFSIRLASGHDVPSVCENCAKLCHQSARVFIDANHTCFYSGR